MREAVQNAIRKYGEPVEIYPRVGQASFVSASVQRPQSDMLVNDVDEDSFVIYVSAADVSQPPLKFDRIRVRGDLRTIHEAQKEVYEGQNIVYVLRVRG